MRKNIPKSLQLKIWARDGWSCRYCGEAVFFAPTLKLLNELSPGHGYYHPNGKTGSMLPLFQMRWASVDHVTPFSKGGEDNEQNYVTACWGCNLKYRERTHEQGKPSPIEINMNAKKLGWDGLSSIYLKLSKKRDAWTALFNND
ncbi:HNH endonuclease [Candidatus Micrarchaeota archaeon]|nr:HNH endonuclease [Candidatus Micrarchaeota archaeon]